MKVVWKSIQSVSNKRHVWCTHDETCPAISAQLWADKQYICQISRSIRVCCIEQLEMQALAHWWLDIHHRYIDLRDEGIGIDDPDVAALVVSDWDLIEEQLLDRVPRPSEEYLARFSQEHPFHHRRRWESQHPPFAKALGLPSWPVSREQLTSQFRRVSLRAHPDRGGDHDEFVRLSKAYHEADEALTALRSIPPKGRQVAAVIDIDQIIRDEVN